jgi:gliding motility-associated-like protein
MIKMRVRKIIPALFALLMPMGAMAQEEYPDVSPTATYTDTEGNPAESDKDNTQIAGQAPLSVNFYANPTGMGDYIPNYEWHFRRLGETKDFMVRYEENTDYTFNDAGTTMVTLRTTLNNGEIELDSVSFNVVISVSTLLFPNAFSPNGDEDNPIFKAKEYRSIIEFHAYIFNRWGQKLYEWTNPAEGWDGTYKGKDVKEGVYFLLCRAKGADGTEYNIRKDINLLRGFLEDGSTNQ